MPAQSRPKITATSIILAPPILLWVRRLPILVSGRLLRGRKMVSPDAHARRGPWSAAIPGRPASCRAARSVSRIEFDGNRRPANQHQNCAGVVPSGTYRPQLNPPPPELGPISNGARHTDSETGRGLSKGDRPATPARRPNPLQRPSVDSAKGYPNRERWATGL
jgi:hypothetical protein